MDNRRFQRVVRDLYALVRELESMFDRPFTPDGHLVGSLGECLVADAYNLELMPPSNPGFDALAPDGKQVEIKATQSKSVAFRSPPEHCIAILIRKDGSFEEIYNGPGSYVWNLVKHKPLPSNGQYQISLSVLSKLQSSVGQNERIARTK